MVVVEGLFKCMKFKSKNTEYDQFQTRGGDKPMTSYHLCNNCGRVELSMYEIQRHSLRSQQQRRLDNFQRDVRYRENTPYLE